MVTLVAICSASKELSAIRLFFLMQSILLRSGRTAIRSSLPVAGRAIGYPITGGSSLRRIQSSSIQIRTCTIVWSCLASDFKIALFKFKVENLRSEPPEVCD